jgi:hypothetical protein
MNAPSPWLRPLRVAAILLALANAALFVAWLQQDPPLPSPAIAHAATDAGAESATAERAAAPIPVHPDKDLVPARADESAPTGAAEGVVLFGSVTRHDGSKPAQGFLSVSSGDETMRATQTDNGYAFAGLRPGTWTLTGRFDDELPFRHEVVVTAPRTRFDVVLQKAWVLTVHAVTPEGEPLLEAAQKATTGFRWFQGLTALAFDEPLTAELPLSSYSEARGGIGTFRTALAWRSDKTMPKQTVGVVTLPPDRPVHVALLVRRSLVAQMPVTPGQTEVTFTVTAAALLARAATVRMRVVDANGAPVTDARVGLSDAQSGGAGEKVDAEGRATIRHLQPGLLDIDVGHAKLRAAPRRIEVHPGVDLDLGDIVLQAAVDVQFVFEPIESGVRMQSTCLEPLPGPGWHRDIARFGGREEGTLEAKLSPGRHAVFASGKTTCALVEVDTRALPPMPIRVAMRPGARLHVDNRAGPTVVRAVVTTPSGAIVFENECTGTWQRDVLVPPGTYEVELVRSQGTTKSRLTVGADGASLVVE